MIDGQAPLGVATTRSLERVMAAVGLLDGAPIQFQALEDVSSGGVLCALPALLAYGLLQHTRETFALPKGYYPIETIFLTLALLALGRVGSLEALRYEAPGEWGKLVGLDRIPEVKTLREKIGILCDEAGRAQRWSGTLAREWMAGSPESAGALYIDGHVRVYHGGLTKLPRRYVARERLCLRGTTDYWVNAMDGQPFFVVTQPVNPGLLTVLREEIVPRLKQEVPGQPSAAELAADPLLSRFTLVYDREGYSPEFMAQMKAERIAVSTYHKFPGDKWAPEEFVERMVQLVNGEEVNLALAERGTCLSNGLWVREVRQRDAQGHQTSILSTDYRRALDQVAVRMFARWCQENFFKYMGEHYGLDRLIEYGTQPLPDSTRVVNPAWRSLDSEIRRQLGLCTREQAQFGALHLPSEAAAEQIAVLTEAKAQRLQSLQTRQQEIDKLKEQRRQTPRHVELKDLPEQDRFSQLRTDRKHFVDTIKLIAYRAETALVQIVREKLKRWDDARALIRQVFDSAVDLRPDHAAKTLTVRIHRATTAGHDTLFEHLCAELTETDTVYPGTELRLVYEIVGSHRQAIIAASDPPPSATANPGLNHLPPRQDV